MQTTTPQLTSQTLKGKLHAAYAYLLDHNDQINSAKVKHLANKLVNSEFTIAFCGHFSAGKSTLINNLIGEDLLPASPIPTSANLVKIKAGKAAAKVFFKNAKPRLYLAPYNYDLVKNYCTNGDQIEKIEISYANFPLPRQTIIMDTPGIDSADDAHRIATQSAIHLADLIFYVIDYNHVQSELNFIFTKELTQAGKEIYLVINQIDKHSPQELSFAAFQTTVLESFAAWGVKLTNIFYTSLKYPTHAHNQFPALQHFLSTRLKATDTLLLQAIFQSLQQLIADHLAVTKQNNRRAIEPARHILDELSACEQKNLLTTASALLTQKNDLSTNQAEAARNFDLTVNKILANAYLIPFQTRALAESYLAACQNNFKIGLLFSKQKTRAEKQLRLETLYQALRENTKSQIEWQLRDGLIKFVQITHCENSTLLSKIQNFTINFSSEILIAAVKPGANLSGETVINYTNTVATAISQITKQLLAGLKQEILQTIQATTTAKQVKLTKQTVNIERYLAALEQVKKSTADELLQQTQLTKLLTETCKLEADIFHLFTSEVADCEIIAGIAAKSPLLAPTTFPCESPPLNLPPTTISTNRLETTAVKLHTAANLVHALPGFNKIAEQLREKAARLEHKGFTVALFGAFSAGKSSFANALIGAKILPVSPNPTTAAINKIKQPTATYPHGTVIIKLKSTPTMLEAVNKALKIFAIQVPDLTVSISAIATIAENIDQHTTAETANYSFLQAFRRGYPSFSEQLGTIRQTTLTEFADYVAIEEKSCFVEWIELYYDCPLTSHGITLVDTPGADSINTRHTGAAFDFIKNADAILFITYFNHAFSHADREFLIQLGRVKDSFQLDKMFFIINAIDLANDAADQALVKQYVHGQLIKYGVKQPQLFSLSSLRGLQEKQAPSFKPNSAMTKFEQSFYHFITNDLANLTVNAADNELARIEHLIEKFITSSTAALAVKTQQRTAFTASQTSIHALLNHKTSQSINDQLNQEIAELIYYIKQRVFLRFNDFFKETFNPSVLRDDGRNLQTTLHLALTELLEQIGFDLAQELRATTVRLDRFAEKALLNYQLTLVTMINELTPDIAFPQFEFTEIVSIAFESAFKNIAFELFAPAMTYFKNTKSFFEHNANRQMRDELAIVLSAATDSYLHTEQQRIKIHYAAVIDTAFNKLIFQMNETTTDFYLSLLATLDGGIPPAKLIAIQQNLRKL